MVIQNEQMVKDTVEKLKKVFYSNVVVPLKNFDMSVFKSECGTRGCLIGNSIHKFEKDGLVLKTIPNSYEQNVYQQNITFPVLIDKEGNQVEDHQTSLRTFFNLDEEAEHSIFLEGSLSKEEAMKNLEEYINYLIDEYELNEDYVKYKEAQTLV